MQYHYPVVGIGKMELFQYRNEGKQELWWKPGSSEDSRSSSRSREEVGNAEKNEAEENEKKTDEKERKRRRMLLNRESARRSRLRRQQHLEQLMTNVEELRAQNSEMVARFTLTSKRFAHISAENRALRSQAMSLEARLHDLLLFSSALPLNSN